MNKEFKGQQYFIPSSAGKMMESSQDRKLTNLSNMKTYGHINTSSDKHKGERKTDSKLSETQDVNSIQNRLKKLIGVNKQPLEHKLGDTGKHNEAIQKKKDSLGISEHIKKEKKEKSVNKKKNMKLNISSESLTKVSNEVETFLNQRFPMTAPNKEGKDRKLFQATGRDIKHSAKLPKKVIAEEPSRKVVRTNIDALNALQNSVYNTGSKKLVAPINKSALGKVGSLKGPTSATIVKNSKGAPVESMKNVGPGKSFRNNKMAEYIKNNFFLKTNYKGAGKMNEPSPKASSKNKSSEGHSRSKALNQTDGNAGSQNWKSEEVISEADAFNMNLEDILYIEKRLNSIQEIIEKDFEIYDQVKEYVDIVQEQNYAVFFAPIKVAKLRDLVKNSMVLERWAMFFVFFYYFNQSLALENIEMLRQLVFLIHKNSLLYLRMYSQWIANSPALESTYKSLNNLSLRRNIENGSLFEERGDDFKKMKKNNQSIISIFRLMMHQAPKEISRGIIEVIANLDSMTLKEGLECCLDSFCQFLIEKGVVSVEYSNESGKNKHDTPMTDSTKTELVSSLPQKPEEPFLPSHDMKYTLVMDLDETLVHYEDNGVTGQFYLRPYAQEFINEMSKYYEIVIFTAALQDYADWIINRLDTKNRISHRLYRHHTTNSANNYHIKDLSKLGRSLSKTIIVDNIPENFQLQAENGIFIKSWFKDPEDCALLELMPLLKEIVIKGYSDVRVALKKFRDKMIENITRGCLQPHLNLTLD